MKWDNFWSFSKNQYFNDIDHEHFGLVLPKKDGYELRCFFTRKAHSAFSPSKKALALNLARIDFEVFWSLVKHHRHSFPGLGTVSHSPSLEEVQDEAASNINIFDTFFSTFLTNFSDFNSRYISYWLQPLLVFLRLQMSNVIEGYVCDFYRNFNCKSSNIFYFLCSAIPSCQIPQWSLHGEWRKL